jgi:uncharacterized membrane protein YesL
MSNFTVIASILTLVAISFLSIFLPCHLIQNKVKHYISIAICSISFILMITFIIIDHIPGQTSINNPGFLIFFLTSFLTYVIYLIITNSKKETSKNKTSKEESEKIDIKNL